MLLHAAGGVEGSFRQKHNAARDAVNYRQSNEGKISDGGEEKLDAMFAPMLLRRSRRNEAKIEKQLTRHILANMDTSSDPCDDFYRYSCGGWINQNQIPPDQSIWGTLDQIQRVNDEKLSKKLGEIDVSGLAASSAVWKAKMIFDQCVDENRTDARTPALMRETAREIAMSTPGVAESGRVSEEGKTDLKNAYYEQKALEDWDFNAALIRAHKFYGSKSLFDFFPFTDNFVFKRRILKFEEGGLAFSNPAYFKNPNKTTPYRDLVLGVAKEALLLSDADAARFAGNLMRFEEDLAAIYVKPEEKVDTGQTFHKVPIRRLFDGQSANDSSSSNSSSNSSTNSSSSLKIDWLRMLEAHGLFNFTPDTPVDLSNLPYFSNLNRLVAASGKERLRDYLVWTVINVQKTSVLPTPIQSLYREYRRRVYGKTSDHPLPIRCLKIVAKIFPFTVSFLYQNASFPSSHKKYITSLVKVDSVIC